MWNSNQHLYSIFIGCSTLFNENARTAQNETKFSLISSIIWKIFLFSSLKESLCWVVSGLPPEINSIAFSVGKELKSDISYCIFGFGRFVACWAYQLFVVVTDYDDFFFFFLEIGHKFFSPHVQHNVRNENNLFYFLFSPK